MRRSWHLEGDSLSLSFGAISAMTTTTTTITDLIQIKDQGEQKKMAYVFGEDITENLKSLSFEAGVSEDERYSTQT